MVELMIVLAIIATVMAMAVPKYARLIKQAEDTVAVKDIREIQAAIDSYEQQTGALPLTLDDLGLGPLLDPWGNPYQYLNMSQVKGKGKLRKDKFLVPINSTYDLYSMGPDGKSTSPLTAASSQDDIIRANDGEFIGVASSY